MGVIIRFDKELDKGLDNTRTNRIKTAALTTEEARENRIKTAALTTEEARAACRRCEAPRRE